MADIKKVIRVPFNIHRANPKHEEVYQILEQAENKNDYIRKAIIFYHQHKEDSFQDGVTLEEIERVVKQGNEELLSRLSSILESQSGLDYEKLRNIF